MITIKVISCVGTVCSCGSTYCEGHIPHGYSEWSICGIDDHDELHEWVAFAPICVGSEVSIDITES
jgi:muconolactone delta-isomerase